MNSSYLALFAWSQIPLFLNLHHPAFALHPTSCCSCYCCFSVGQQSLSILPLQLFFFLAHLQLTQVLTSLHCIIWFRSCFSSWPLTDGWHKHTWHVDTNDTRWEYWWPTRQEKRVALGPPLAKSNYLCRWTITRIDALALLCHLGRFLTNW